MGRPKGMIRKARLIPAEWLTVYTRYVKRALEERGVPERNQPKNDDLIALLAVNLGAWLDWKRIDEFIDGEARKRGTWAFHEKRSPPAAAWRAPPTPPLPRRANRRARTP